MPASLLMAAAIVLFTAGYVFYGRFLARRMDIDPLRKTPAHVRRDGVDYVPAKWPVLLGHHFASIAGAGPIIGPIYAAVFGWVPVFLWILVGSLFFGGVHDFTALVASIRHGGKSIGEVIEERIGRSGKRMFLVFTWFMLILVMAVFMNAVAGTFVTEPASATASMLFILLAVLFGLTVYRMKAPLGITSVAGVILLLGCIALGLRFPLTLPYGVWIAALLVYVYAASVTPVWILLQPRDYLNAFLLYMILLGGMAGIFVTRPTVSFPAVTAFRTDAGFLFPVLFVTMACGAISGFHSLIGSGTTAKQLDRETDARIVGYGGMLIEGILAVVALITAVTLLQPDYFRAVTIAGGGPIRVFASGVGGFIASLGIPMEIAVTFAALAISAFALTSLDTATRLGRFVFQEFFENRGGGKSSPLSKNRYIGTTVTVGAAALLMFSGSGAALWPLFGSANQLLAALALLAVTLWLAKAGKKNGFTKIPMIFMFAVTLAALGNLIYDNAVKGNVVLLVIGVVLLGLAGSLIAESVRRLRKG
ncbi:MAG TPA: carbon starvation protein A [bacterium]|nr:carbon starvation protein A [bacterium]